MAKYRFTLVAYNPKPNTNFEDLHAADGTLVMTVIPMSDWQHHTVERVMRDLRGD